MNPRIPTPLARTLSIGCRVAQGLCLLVMAVSATAFMLVWVYFDRRASMLGSAAAGVLWCAIGLLFAFVFEQPRTPRATLRFMVSRIAGVVVLAAAAAYLVGTLWIEPERAWLDANTIMIQPGNLAQVRSLADRFDGGKSCG
jgi:hypothetical protein